MKRPYVICHILSSLDGKINGPFMGTQSAGSLAREYGQNPHGNGRRCLDVRHLHCKRIHSSQHACFEV